MAKSQFTNRQKNITRLIRDRRDLQKARISAKGASARLTKDFLADLQLCEEVTLDTWKRRSLFEKIVEPFCWILERQQ